MASQLASNFVSAALRHIRDAEHLLDGPYASRDQAWHLAGFAHECARKACLSDGWIPKLLGHDFSSVGELTVTTAAALDPRANRFPIRNWTSRFTAISAWAPDHRYEATGTTDKQADRDLEALVRQGREATDACILALFLEGVLVMESLR